MFKHTVKQQNVCRCSSELNLRLYSALQAHVICPPSFHDPVYSNQSHVQRHGVPLAGCERDGGIHVSRRTTINSCLVVPLVFVFFYLFLPQQTSLSLAMAFVFWQVNTSALRTSFHLAILRPPPTRISWNYYDFTGWKMQSRCCKRMPPTQQTKWKKLLRI